MACCVLSLVLASCSTTKRLGKDEVLYTGVKKVNIVAPAGDVVPDEIKTEIKDAVNVPANNTTGVFGLQVPIPLGLWVYNAWSPDSKGIKGWIYKKLVKQPVLITDVRPQQRVKMIENKLDNLGYFRNSTTYELDVNKKNPKKAKIINN